MLPPPGAADARPAEHGSAAALPMEPHDGGTLYITAEHVAVAGGRSLVTGP